MPCRHRRIGNGLAIVLAAVLASKLSWAVTVSRTAENMYAYFAVTDQAGASSIAQFQIANDGKLKPLKPATIPAGSNLISLTASPDGNYLFALDNGDSALGTPGTFFRFSIHRDGTLASNPITSTGPLGIACPFTLSPDGKSAFVPQGNTAISYGIDSSGKFTLVSTVAAGNNACAAAIDPTGQFLYVGNFADHTISEYRIAENGELTSNGLVSTAPNEVYLLVFGPEGFLYSAGCCQLEGPEEYAIDPSSGTITELIPFLIGHLPWSLAFNPGGTYAYTVNADAGPISVSALRVDKATGALSKNGSDIPISGIGAGSIAVDPSGRFVFLAQFSVPSVKSGTISMFRINRSEKLTRNGTVSLDIASSWPSGSIAFAQR